MVEIEKLIHAIERVEARMASDVADMKRALVIIDRLEKNFILNQMEINNIKFRARELMGRFATKPDPSVIVPVGQLDEE